MNYDSNDSEESAANQGKWDECSETNRQKFALSFMAIK